MNECLPATDWNAISAIAASVAAIAAIGWQLSELRHRRHVRRTELALRLDERFDSLEFRHTRIRAAQYLLNPTTDDGEGEDALYSILNFFEGIAYHWKQKLLNDESVWFHFAYWLLPYYNVAKKQIGEARDRDPDALTDLENMVASVGAYKYRRRSASELRSALSNERAVEFLKDEAALFVG
jgi:hypothetical protein